jgi:hypothetical protein
MPRQLRTLSGVAPRGAVVDYYPIKLDIENVSSGNFRCTKCAVSGWHKGERAVSIA